MLVYLHPAPCTQRPFDASEDVEYNIVDDEEDPQHVVPGSANLKYTNVLLPASPHVSTFIRDVALDIFDAEDFQPYDPRFLAGLSAERHHIAVDTAMKNAESDFHFKRRAVIGYLDGVDLNRIANIRASNTRTYYKRVLIPVWMIHYNYNGETYTGVVSGHDHSVYGRRPVARWKLAVLFTRNPNHLVRNWLRYYPQLSRIGPRAHRCTRGPFFKPA